MRGWIPIGAPMKGIREWPAYCRSIDSGPSSASAGYVMTLIVPPCQVGQTGPSAPATGPSQLAHLTAIGPEAHPRVSEGGIVHRRRDLFRVAPRSQRVEVVVHRGESFVERFAPTAAPRPVLHHTGRSGPGRAGQDRPQSTARTTHPDQGR